MITTHVLQQFMALWLTKDPVFILKDTAKDQLYLVGLKVGGHFRKAMQRLMILLLIRIR